MFVRASRFFVASVFSVTAVVGCGKQNSNTPMVQQKQESEKLLGNDELLGLTQAECKTTALSSVTASPRGQLYINAPAVLNDARAKNSSNNAGPGGAWSFANALREILELPSDPGNTAANLLAEEKAVDAFISMFGAQAVNNVTASARSATASMLRNAWGKRTDAAGTSRRWLGGAPFKLIAIVNRMDIVKMTNAGTLNSTTAGEGRLVFGFTGAGAMSVIFEYDLPVGTLSPIFGTTQASWTALWRGLKNHLVDTVPGRSGVQPNESLLLQPSFANQASYLSALEQVTNRFVRRTSQKRSAASALTQAAISQIRTNEFIESPWQLRELVRNRALSGVAVLAADTTKNALVVNSGIVSGSGVLSRSDAVLGAWIDGNVSCSSATDLSTCSFKSANQLLPSTISQNGKIFRVGPVSVAGSGQWFAADSGNMKRRFFALGTCDGCHQSETRAFFTHADLSDGTPSSFLTSATTVGNFQIEADLARRLRNFKNLVCLAAPTSAGLNLETSGSVVAPLEMRVGTSSSVH